MLAGTYSAFNWSWMEEEREFEEVHEQEEGTFEKEDHGRR